MEQYIPKSALVAEIEKNLRFIPEHVTAFDEGEEHAYHKILSFLDTLEVKEVDFTKELETFSMDLATKVNDGNWNKDIAVTAKHFFEFGLKARTDKELVDEVYSHLDNIKDTADRINRLR